MKVFIVFLGLLIVNVNLMNFHGGLGRYIELQNTLKMASEECAAQAALLFDEEAFKEGSRVFDYEAGEKDSMNYLSSICHKLGIYNGYDLTLRFEDDLSSYSTENLDKLPRVTATVSVDVSRLFTRTPLERKFIQRSSCYEVK